MFQGDASKVLFQSGSLKSSASGSSRAATDNFNHSVHLPPAAPVHAEPGTGRFTDRDVDGRYAGDWHAGGDTEDDVRDEWMSSHPSQFNRAPAVDVSLHGQLSLHC